MNDPSNYHCVCQCITRPTQSLAQSITQSPTNQPTTEQMGRDQKSVYIGRRPEAQAHVSRHCHAPLCSHPNVVYMICGRDEERGEVETGDKVGRKLGLVFHFFSQLGC